MTPVISETDGLAPRAAVGEDGAVANQATRSLMTDAKPHVSVIPPSMQDIARTHPLSTAFLLGASLTTAFGTGAFLARSLLRLTRLSPRPGGSGQSQSRSRAALSQLDVQFHRSVTATLAQSEARLATRLEQERADRQGLMVELGQLRAALATQASQASQGGGVVKGQTDQGPQQLQPQLAQGQGQGQAAQPWAWIQAEQRVATSTSPSSSPADKDTRTALTSPAVRTLQEVPSKGSSAIRLPGPAVAVAQHSGEKEGRHLPVISASSPPLPSPSSLTATAAGETKKNPSYEVPRRTFIPQYGGLRAGIGRHGPLPIVDSSNPNYM